MKIAQKLCGALLTAAALIILAPGAYAQGAEDYGDWTGVDELIRQLPDTGEGTLDEERLRDAGSVYEVLLDIFESIPQSFTKYIKEGLKQGAVIVCIAAICGIAGSMSDNKNLEWAVELAGIAAVTAVACGSIGFISLGADTTQQLSDWSMLVLPVMASAAASAGGVSSAAVKYAAATLGISVISQLVSSLVMPLIFAYLAMSVAAAAFGERALKAAAKLVKRIVTWILTLSSGLLLSYLVLSGATAVSVDAVAAKSVKTALNALPVVGGITSDAASAVLAGAAAVRSTAGIIGVIGVLTVCLGPVLKLAAQILIFKGAAALAGCFATDRLSGLIDDFASAMGISLGSCGLAALMLFFSLVSLMQAVSI